MERIHALLLRVARAADVGLLLPEDADWIRDQAVAMNPPEPAVVVEVLRDGRRARR